MTAIDQKNIEVLIERLADIGRAGEGVTRLAYTIEETTAHSLIKDYMKLHGFTSTTDAAGNTLIGNIENPMILMGSHLDTVPNGGKYDGAAGIVAGTEVLKYLKEIGEEQGVCLAIFRAEESSRFGRGLIGSTAFCSGISKNILREAKEKDGKKASLYEAIRSCGLNPEEIKKPNPLLGNVKAYFELHIEQDNELYKKKKILGIVDLVATPVRYEFILTGAPKHTGTRNIKEGGGPLEAMSDIIIILLKKMNSRSKSTEYPVIGTVPYGNTAGGYMNQTATTAVFGLDIRSAYKQARDEFVNEFFDGLKVICEKYEVTMDYFDKDQKDPVKMDSKLNKVVESTPTAIKNQKKIMHMNSKASHDAVNFANVKKPSELLLVQSIGGSHNYKEYSNPEHIALTTQILAEGVLKGKEVYR